MSSPSNRARNTRLVVLFAVLALLLAGLWYDYKVARPSVDVAYDTVAQLNEQINQSTEKKATTNLDVQKALNRQPANQTQAGPYTVEVYSWMAGLPFRTRDYYAVYMQNGPELRFVTHYKHKLPESELTADSRRSVAIGAVDESEMPDMPTIAPGEEEGQDQEKPKSGKRKRDRGEPVAAETSTSPETDKPEPAAEPAQGDAKEKPAPFSEPAAETKPATETKPAAEAKPVAEAKPAAETKPAELSGKKDEK